MRLQIVKNNGTVCEYDKVVALHINDSNVKAWLSINGTTVEFCKEEIKSLRYNNGWDGADDTYVKFK